MQFPGFPEDYEKRGEDGRPAGHGLPVHLARELTQGHEGPILAVRYNQAGTYCLSCGKVCARAQRSGRSWRAAPHSPQTRGAQGSACALQDRKICLWNPHKGALVKSYLGHGYEVRDVSVSSDNSKFASVGGDKQVRARHLMCPTSAPAPRWARGPPRSTPPAHPTQVFVWDVVSGNFIRKLRGHDSTINAVRAAAGGRAVPLAGPDRRRVARLPGVCAGGCRSRTRPTTTCW